MVILKVVQFWIIFVVVMLTQFLVKNQNTYFNKPFVLGEVWIERGRKEQREERPKTSSRGFR